MRSRLVVPVVLLLLAGGGLTACGEDGLEGVLPTSLPTELPTELPTALPTLPGGGNGETGGGETGGGETGGGETGGGETGGGETGDQGTAAAPTSAPSPSPTDQTGATANEGSGLPVWAWVVIGLAGLALVLALVSLLRRRGGNDRDLAAQAEGQLAWVRSQVDDPLVRWRGQQLGLPADQRDADSELARRWALIDQRVTAATTDLLTLQSGARSDAVRESAGMLRTATESYRGSLDALAAAVATGDQARIAQASQGFTADTSLLDQARTRFRQVSGL